MFANRKIAILGLGRTGVACAKWALRNGIEATCWDENQDLCESLPNDIKIIKVDSWEIKSLDYIIVSPGIKLLERYPELTKLAKQYKVPIVNDIELYALVYPNKHYVGITGTNGKSTIASLIYHILQSNNHKVALAGNIGTAVFEIDPNSFHTMILEISSYQLLGIYHSFLSYTILTNLTSDHVDYHGSYEEYKRVKLSVVSHTKINGIIIANQGLIPLIKPIIRGRTLIGVSDRSDKAADIFLNDTSLIDNYFFNNLDIDISCLYQLQALHNKFNFACAYVVSRLLNIQPEKIIELTKSFQLLPHRQYPVCKIDKIAFINDSKATGVNSTISALKSFKNIYLILGGQKSYIEAKQLIPHMKTVRKVFLVGEMQEFFAAVLKEYSIPYHKSEIISNAVPQAFSQAKQDINKYKMQNACVLLSPACKSFDQFRNFEHRGDEFIRCVEKLVVK